MATPLRKDQPEFGDEEITTADVAQGKRAMSDTRGRQVVDVKQDLDQVPRTDMERDVERNVTENNTAPLFPGDELSGLRTRWKEIQTAFVDEPRKAVEQADGLVASAMTRLAEEFANERAGLEKQWDRGDSVSTEDLRVALQRYRSFFDRLLSV
jgi:hypothetical protein